MFWISSTLRSRCWEQNTARTRVKHLTASPSGPGGASGEYQDADSIVDELGVTPDNGGNHYNRLDRKKSDPRSTTAAYSNYQYSVLTGRGSVDLQGQALGVAGSPQPDEHPGPRVPRADMVGGDAQHDTRLAGKGRAGGGDPAGSQHQTQPFNAYARASQSDLRSDLGIDWQVKHNS